MLFNSYSFCLGFLPVAVLGFVLFGRFGRHTQIAWLAAISLFFYGWWDWRFVGLLAASILFNFTMGRLLATDGEQWKNWRKHILIVAVACNLFVLGLFKYLGFLSFNLSTLVGWRLPVFDLALPLGISFYTFTQIAFLVDAYRGEAREYNFINYTAFVTYFPHLIAGPLFHHKQMMPQFANTCLMKLKAENVAIGLTIFIVGLSKKVLLADNIASYADGFFAPGLSNPTTIEAWAGALAFTLQLYFDFSGYSDMAIGLSRIFGIEMPINFNSPYKALSIIDFWRRWHITLSTFLRDYLYIPLGGNRSGSVRRYRNLIITMLLGGLWHGAGWTYVIWGGLHGAYLIVNHAWRVIVPKRDRTGALAAVGRLASMLLTFVMVVIAWVFFRADSLDAAWAVMRGMAGLNGAPVPAQWMGGAGFIGQTLGQWLASLGLSAADLPRFGGAQQMVWSTGLLLIAWVMPNTQEFVHLQRSYVTYWDQNRAILHSRWMPSAAWGAACAAVGGVCLFQLAQPSKFLYFQF